MPDASETPAMPAPPGTPDLRAGRLSAESYAAAFSDAAPRFTETQALVEAERCLYCYDAPCMQACPTGIDVPSFIRRIADGNLRGAARKIAKHVKNFGHKLPWVFLKAKTEEVFVQSQYQHERIADIAIDLYAGSCVLARLDHLLTSSNGPIDKAALIAAGKHFLDLADRRIQGNFARIDDHDDADCTAAADAALAVG